jgi:glucosylceramidase
MSNYPFYAKYFVKFLNAYATEGVPIQAVTVQNEVETDQDGNMPACIWPMGYEADFVKWHLGPALAEAKLDVGLWIIDHNYDLWGRATQVLEDADLRKYVKGIAWHGYLGSVDMVSRVKDAHPDVDMFFTEHTPVLGAPDYLTDWTNWGKIIGGTMRNWCRNFTIWNLALDEKGNPNIGPFGCGGVVTINSQTHEVTRSGAYWGLAHYSKFVKRGAKRIASDGDFDGLTHVAFKNPEGEHVLVLSNSGETRTIPVEMGEMIAEIHMEKDSVMTLVWA